MKWNIYSLSDFHSILTPVEWKFTTQQVKSRPVYFKFAPKEVTTDVTTQGVKIKWTEWFFFREYNLVGSAIIINNYNNSVI